MRLIDADKLYLPLEEMVSRMSVYCATTIDAVPVIRCKKCKYLGDEIQDDYGGKYRLCKEHGGQVRLEDFCSWAEEREE